MCGVSSDSLSLKTKNIGKNLFTLNPEDRVKNHIDTDLDFGGVGALQQQKSKEALEERQKRIDAVNADTINNAPLNSINDTQKSRRRKLARNTLLTDEPTTLLT